MTLFKESPKNGYRSEYTAATVAVAEPTTLPVASINRIDDENRAFDYQEPTHVLPRIGMGSSGVGDFSLRSNASEPSTLESSMLVESPPQVNESHGFLTAGTSQPIEVSDEQLALAGDLLSNGATEHSAASAKSQLLSSKVGFQTAGMSKSIAVSAEQLRAAEQLLNERDGAKEALDMNMRHESNNGRKGGCEGDGDEFDDPVLDEAMCKLPY